MEVPPSLSRDRDDHTDQDNCVRWETEAYSGHAALDARSISLMRDFDWMLWNILQDLPVTMLNVVGHGKSPLIDRVAY